ncbi:hypothetical protein SARC_05230 [Sphaeroforma arctica JP610]|uniref:Uncharacterized protein n=1 Tax=Sphaeroforma arctica JP610 TaxID=667725 RepID=A0A0L0G2Q2_9EUKA|nr:hypothetical protein SARC_05230 [Sphaeroforma arctica JP610]KNC82478.1 hypothetical protein SARC_05230 [Sphaeroforma arctica JP610]|eukprot:XP_014156380.1 hypothetical protein SARC_05230 [Sphaeroforma arctica JP610]
MDTRKNRRASMQALSAVSFEAIPENQRVQHHHRPRSNTQRHMRASLSNASRSFTRKVSRTLSRTTSVRSLQIHLASGVLILLGVLLFTGVVAYIVSGLELNSSTVFSVWSASSSQFCKNCRNSMDAKGKQEGDIDTSNQHTMLTHADKLFICDQLQGLIDDIQNKYALYIQTHQYPNMKRYTVMDNNTPPYAKTACPSYMPGVIKARAFALNKTVDNPYHYCFGGTSMPGPRQCDFVVPDYTVKSADKQAPMYPHILPPGQQNQEQPQYNGKVGLYGKSFAYKTHYYKSMATKKASADENDDTITLSTQGTWSRIGNIVTLAQRWQGPISFALFFEKNDGSNAIELLDKFIADNEYVAQYVDFHLVWRDDHRDIDEGAFYPINLLRNIALQPVKSSHVFIIDADIIPNAGHTRYIQWVADAEGSAAVQNKDKSASCPGLQAFIPPAVEMDADSLSRMYASGNSPRADTLLTKSQVVQGLFKGQVRPMHQYFGPAYLPTNHYSWMSSEETTELTYLTRFEPYYIARMPIPLFNETFINRGGNFAQQVYEMAAGGYSFFRLSDAFVVDIPHTHAKPEASAKADTKDTTDLRDREVSEDSGRNRSVPQASAGGNNGSGVITENLTKQINHNENFIRNMWTHFYEHMQRRYLSNIVSPEVAERNFRTYRRTQDRIAKTLWNAIATQEYVEKYQQSM